MPLQDKSKLQDEVFGFDPREQGLPVDGINILLCGGVGAGKSSIISTIDSMCQGRISRRAPHGQGTGSLTRKLRKYKFTDPDTRHPLKWKLWDSMGWGVSDHKGGELGFILDGNLPDRCKLEGQVSMKTEGFNTHPTLQDAVHCMCLVVPCDSATNDSYMSRLREMRQFARDRGKYMYMTLDYTLHYCISCRLLQVYVHDAGLCLALQHLTSLAPLHTQCTTGFILIWYH